MKPLIIALALLATLGAATLAQPVIDGNAAESDGYGAALSIQNTDTQFGNAGVDDPIFSGEGSEIDQVFGVVSGDRLFVTIAGNLQTNFNKLVVFIDSDTGTGVNTLDGTNLPDGFDPFCGRCGGGFETPFGENPVDTLDGGLQNMTGLTFDAGFTADYVLSFTGGVESVNDTTTNDMFYALSAHYADLTQGGEGTQQALGIITAPQGLPNVLRAEGGGFSDPAVTTETIIGPALPNLGPGQLIDQEYALSVDGGCDDATGAGCIAPELEFVLPVDPAETGQANPADNNASDHRDFLNTVDLELAIDNSNTEGVEGFAGAGLGTLGNPQDVTTGVEFSIPLSEIGSPTGDIRITAFVNGTDYDFASNQFSGVGIDDVNPGSDGEGNFVGDQLAIDLSTIAGDQFVTVEFELTIPDGDYNGDGVVNAADYTVWRDNLGTTNTLPGDTTPGSVDADDYQVWFNNFGATGSASMAVAVPEPSMLALAAFVGLGSPLRWRR